MFIGYNSCSNPESIFAKESWSIITKKISDKTKDLYDEANDIIETGKEKTEKIIRESKKSYRNNWGCWEEDYN